MGILLLLFGLGALLWMLFQRAGGFAMVGSTLGLGLSLIVLFYFRDGTTPSLLGIIFGAVSVALYATTPPAEELAESIGGTLPNQRDREGVSAPMTLPPPAAVPSAEPTGDRLTLTDHVWLVGLPLVGFLVSFIALDRSVGLVEGVWVHLISGTPGSGFAFGTTDVAALFGLLLIFPGGKTALVLPLTGLVAVMAQLGKNRPTAGAAAIEYGVVALLINLTALLWFGLP